MLLSTANLWNLKLNIDLDDILKFSSYVRENTLCLHYQANQVTVRTAAAAAMKQMDTLWDTIQGS
jgi:hypothetical protein